MCHGVHPGLSPPVVGAAVELWNTFCGAGLTVSLPRLPGHGTTWQDMNRTRSEDWFAEAERSFEVLRGKTDEIFLMGLSLGGCIALRIAELRGAAVRGLVVVNPSITADTRLFWFAPAMKLFVPSLKGIASDIKKDGTQELGYDRVPVRAAATLPRLWRATRDGLDQISQPVLAYHSTEDHARRAAQHAAADGRAPPAKPADRQGLRGTAITLPP